MVILFQVPTLCPCAPLSGWRGTGGKAMALRLNSRFQPIPPTVVAGQMAAPSFRRAEKVPESRNEPTISFFISCVYNNYTARNDSGLGLFCRGKTEYFDLAEFATYPSFRQTFLRKKCPNQGTNPPSPLESTHRIEFAHVETALIPALCHKRYCRNERAIRHSRKQPGCAGGALERL